MLAQKVEGNCSIEAVEFDNEAIIDAQINIDACKWSNSIRLHNVDFTAYQPKKLFDVIISNPPFFEGLASTVKNRSIARSAADKLSYKNLLKGAANLLKNEGRIYLVLPSDSLNKIELLAEKNNLEIIKQLNVKPKIDKPINRVMLELRKKQDEFLPSQFKDSGVRTKEMIIRDEHNKYTNDHILFTKDYYLKLSC
jgi:tRNA1Val (adenine37-N6)-methyltransferase